VQKDLDIAEYTDPLHNPMIPHTIVLEPGLVVYTIYMAYWFFGRPTVEDPRISLRGRTLLRFSIKRRLKKLQIQMKMKAAQIQRDLIIISCRSSDTWNLIRRQ
jgi:hypothetical protein